MPDDFTTQQAIIVLDKFDWIDNGPCTCGLEVYGDPCPHHSPERALPITTIQCRWCGAETDHGTPDGSCSFACSMEHRTQKQRPTP